MNHGIRLWGGATLLAAVVLTSAHGASATPWDYRPLVIDGGFMDARTAHPVAEPAKGHIGYHHARANAPALWFRLDGNFGELLQIRMGVPTLGRYRLLRPAVAVVAEGLPAPPSDLPFTVPPGFGVHVYETRELDIDLYEEHYAGTVSWRFAEIEHTLDTAGRVYLVGFIPSDETLTEGKFWMTVGTQVNFRLSDLLSTHRRIFQTRKFFEDAVIPSRVFRNSILSLLIATLTLMIAVA